MTTPAENAALLRLNVKAAEGGFGLYVGYDAMAYWLHKSGEPIGLCVGSAETTAAAEIDRVLREMRGRTPWSRIADARP